MLTGASPITIWRERVGMSLPDLAGAANVSPSYLSEIEGYRDPGDGPAYIALARVLRVPVDFLIM